MRKGLTASSRRKMANQSMLHKSCRGHVQKQSTMRAEQSENKYHYPKHWLPRWVGGAEWGRVLSSYQCCLTSTETVRTVRDGESPGRPPRLSHSSSAPSVRVQVQCHITSTDRKDYEGRGAQDVHLDFHTVPELCESTCSRKPRLNMMEVVTTCTGDRYVLGRLCARPGVSLESNSVQTLLQLSPSVEIINRTHLREWDVGV